MQRDKCILDFAKHATYTNSGFKQISSLCLHKLLFGLNNTSTKPTIVTGEMQHNKRRMQFLTAMLSAFVYLHPMVW